MVRLMTFALATYPRIFRQITRMTTGLPPDDPPGRDRTHPATPGSQPSDAREGQIVHSMQALHQPRGRRRAEAPAFRDDVPSAELAAGSTSDGSA